MILWRVPSDRQAGSSPSYSRKLKESLKRDMAFHFFLTFSTDKLLEKAMI